MDNVKSYKLRSFTKEFNAEVKPFEFKEINEDIIPQKISEDQIRLEREFAKTSGFKVDDEVLTLRGLKRQQHQDYENELEQRVTSKVEKISTQAYEEGLKQGHDVGRKEALELTLKELEQKVVDTSKMLEELQGQKQKLLESSKSDIYKIAQSLVKWICLKEISQDQEVFYQNLLEKLVLEMNSKSNLILQVGSQTQVEMEDIIKNLSEKIGMMTGVQIETSSQFTHGMILESQNGVIDASLDKQFEALDELFEKES